MTQVFRAKHHGIKARQVTYDPEKQVVISREVFEFLHGTGPLKGCWFGEKPADAKGNFWWRKFLSAGEVER